MSQALTLYGVLLLALVFLRALNCCLPDCAGYIRFRLLLVWMRFVFRLTIGWHAHHPLSCRFIVGSDVIHWRCRGEYTNSPLDAAHRTTDEMRVNDESRMGARYAASGDH